MATCALQVYMGAVWLVSQVARCCACCRGTRQHTTCGTSTTTTHASPANGDLHQPLLVAAEPCEPSKSTLNSPKTPGADAIGNNLKFRGSVAGSSSSTSKGGGEMVIGAGTIVRGASGSTEAGSISLRGSSGEFDAEVVLQHAESMSHAGSSCGSSSVVSESGSD